MAHERLACFVLVLNRVSAVGQCGVPNQQVAFFNQQSFALEALLLANFVEVVGKIVGVALRFAVEKMPLPKSNLRLVCEPG